MVTRIHITQDDYGYWMTCRQTGLGLELELWGAEDPRSVLDDVWEYEDIEVHYSEPTGLVKRRIGDPEYAAPKARRARRPYTRHRTSMPIPEARL